jgi:hypothetical protein
VSCCCCSSCRGSLIWCWILRDFRRAKHSNYWCCHEGKSMQNSVLLLRCTSCMCLRYVPHDFLHSLISFLSDLGCGSAECVSFRKCCPGLEGIWCCIKYEGNVSSAARSVRGQELHQVRKVIIFCLVCIRCCWLGQKARWSRKSALG